MIYCTENNFLQLAIQESQIEMVKITVYLCVSNVNSADVKDRHEDMSNQKQPTKAGRKVV